MQVYVALSCIVEQIVMLLSNQVHLCIFVLMFILHNSLYTWTICAPFWTFLRHVRILNRPRNIQVAQVGRAPIYFYTFSFNFGTPRRFFLMWAYPETDGNSRYVAIVRRCNWTNQKFFGRFPPFQQLNKSSTDAKRLPASLFFKKQTCL
jgi:hypothetical protein